MSKKLLITEQEKNEIKKLYNINETWLDDTIDFLKSAGKDAYEFIKDKLDFDDNKEDDNEKKDSESKLDDTDFSEKEKEDLQKSVNDLKSKELETNGDVKISAKNLFNKLNLKLNNKKLSLAIVANAVKESSLRCNAKGDSGSYAEEHPEKNIDGFCSFGLWQFNICGGLGIKLVDKKGIKALSNCDDQIDFMISHVQKNNPGDKSIKGYIDWFVDTIERPKDRADAKKKRNQWASSNLNLFDLDVEDIYT
jgi:hypothetical protein